MTDSQPISGRAFLVRYIGYTSLLAVPALAIVMACLYALLRLTGEQWEFFFIAALVYGVVITPSTILVQRRLAGPIAHYLDRLADGEPSDEECVAAFAATMALPVRAAALGFAGWTLPVSVIALVMALRFPSWPLFGFETASMGTAGLAASFTVGVLLAYLVKGWCTPLRDSLTRRLPDPDLRRRLVRPVPLRWKLLTAVTGVTVIPVMIAVLLAHARTADSLERFTVRWQDEILAAIEDELAWLEVDVAQNVLETRALGFPASLRLASLDVAGDDPGPLDRAVAAQVRGDVRDGHTQGDSLSLPSAFAFSWRLVDEERIVLALTPSAELRRDRASTWIVFALLFAIAAAIALCFGHLASSDVSRATERLRWEAEQLASGDLRTGGTYESEDELGELSRSFAGMSGWLRATVSRVAEAADRVEGTAGTLSSLAEGVSGVTADQVSGLSQATSSMESIDAQVRGIASSSQALNGSVEESSSSILELGASGEELNETAAVLSSKVDEVSSSIEQMVRSVRQVVENTGALTEAAEETSVSMEEMASALREVDTTVEETSRLSDRVVRSAERGQAKVSETIEGMEAIREATETAERVIRHLGGRTEEIGAIVDVIDDVADETNLLALNAAIIAAQAGDQGRAFSVVADEIKDLAERVLASTKEIGGLIGSLQEEAANAIGAIERGASSVASGVDRSAEAGMSLEDITRASRESGTRMGAIVGAVREQARAAGHVVELMERVRGGVSEIRTATAEQDRGNVVVYEGAVTMRDVATQVRGTTEEQARGSVRIRQSVEGVRDAVERINGALQEQSRACAEAVELLETVHGRTRSNGEAARQMDSVAKEILGQAEALREDVRRFRV